MPTDNGKSLDDSTSSLKKDEDSSPFSRPVWSTDVKTNPLQPVFTDKSTDGDNNSNKSNGLSLNGSSVQGKFGKSLKHDEMASSTTSSAKGKKSSKRKMSRQKSHKLPWRKKLFSWRYGTVLLLQVSIMLAIGARNAMPMALVCMVDSSEKVTTNDGNDTHLDLNETLPSCNNYTDSPNDTHTDYEFSWDTELQGFILTAHSFLACVGPLLVDFVRHYIGYKWTLTVMSVSTGVLSFLSPMAARLSPYALLGIRTLVGAMVLANIPVIGDTCAWWGPKDEKQMMVSIIFAGFSVGGMISSSVSGALCGIPYDYGWPFVFYFVGIMTLLWVIAWHFLSTQKPEQHPFISEKEKDYIIEHRQGMESVKKKKVDKPPYGTLLTSIPVLALLLASAAENWITAVFFTNLPFFFAKALGFSVLETGLLMSAISAIRVLGLVMWTAIINVMVKKKVQTKYVRKIILCTGFGLGGVCQVCTVFLEREHKWGLVALIFLVMLCHVVGTCIVPVVPQDMAPRYAGALTGLSFSIGGLVAISGPLLVSVLTPSGTVAEWRIVWMIVAGIYALSVTVFAIFGNASLQPWAIGETEAKDKDKANVISSLSDAGRNYSDFSSLHQTSPLPQVTQIENLHHFDITEDIKKPIKASQEKDTSGFESEIRLEKAVDNQYKNGYIDGTFTRDQLTQTDEDVKGKVELSATDALEQLNATMDLDESESGHDDLSVQQLSSAGVEGGYLNEACQVESDSEDEEEEDMELTLSEMYFMTRF